MTIKLWVHAVDQDLPFGGQLCISPYSDDAADAVAWSEEFSGEIPEDAIQLFQVFAAAPELLAALKGIVDDDDSSVSLADQRARWDERMDAARAAIAKTEAEL